MIDFAGQFGRVFYAELECARGGLRQHVAVKTMKCAYTHHFAGISVLQPLCLLTILISVILRLPAPKSWRVNEVNRRGSKRLRRSGCLSPVSAVTLSSLQWFNSAGWVHAGTPACDRRSYRQAVEVNVA